MKKILLGILLIVTFSLLLSPYSYAGARKGRAGYAVKDDNAMKEIQAIKLALRAMERDIQGLQSQQNKGMTAIEQGKIEGRLTWAEGQIAKLWKWVIAMAVVLAIFILGIIMVIFGNRGSRTRTIQQ